MNLNLRIANYIARYAPSRRRIGTYLTKKGCHNIDMKLEEIGYDELVMIQMWMRSFIALGKGEREIIQKLMKKEFPRSLIDESVLQFHSGIYDWDENKHSVERQIRTLFGRGKSKRMIFSLLSQKYPYFRANIELLLVETSDNDSLQREVEKYLKKYDVHQSNGKQKFYAALLRKGFGYDEIKKRLEDSIPHFR